MEGSFHYGADLAPFGYSGPDSDALHGTSSELPDHDVGDAPAGKTLVKQVILAQHPCWRLRLDRTISRPGREGAC
jgi:hypothetical protein